MSISQLKCYCKLWFCIFFLKLWLLFVVSALPHSKRFYPLRGYKAFMDWEKQEGDPFPYYVYGAACSEVEIDCLTGAHKVSRANPAPASEGAGATAELPEQKVAGPGSLPNRQGVREFFQRHGDCKRSTQSPFGTVAEANSVAVRKECLRLAGCN